MNNLNEWLTSGDIESLPADRQEIARLLTMTDRSLRDASVTAVSNDGRFSSAYEAALALATTVLRASGYRARSSSSGHHFRTISLLPELLGEQQRDRARYLDRSRSKRNTAMYRDAGRISKKEVAELIDEVMHLRNDVLDWLRANHPDLT